METWVLLRGLTRSSAHWADFDRALEQALSARVITLDLPGNGLLFSRRSPSTVQGMASHCHNALQALGVTEPVGILAMSLGGMVATQWAVQWPQEVRELVLINTSSRPFNPVWQRMRPSAVADLLQPLLVRSGANAWETAILRRTANHPQKAVLQDWRFERVLRPVTKANAWRQLLAAARYRAPLVAPVPTLVLAGERDRLVNMACSRALAQQWGTELRVHPTAGHDLTLDDPSWVIDEIRRWRKSARP